MIVVVVAAAPTDWLTDADVLEAKFPSLAYDAVTDRGPAEVNAIVQPPAKTVALQFCVPSLTVTVPVGVPLPGAVAVTAKVKSTAWPTADGFGVWAVIVVVVAAAFTV